MNRTKLSDRVLPDYTRAEERVNMISHIVGGAFGIAALVLCVVLSAIKHNAWGVVGSAIYGASLIVVYTMSSVYHGLRAPLAKRVFQVLDHCCIYFLIGGSYTPILFCAIRTISPAWCWTIFGLVWGLAVMATVFTAIDLKKYAKLSMLCYIGMGWCILLAIKPTIAALSTPALAWLVAGGIAYSLGAILYGLGKRHRFMHSVFHIFVLFGSLLQFICIFYFVL